MIGLHNNINYLMLISDSFMSGMSLYLAYVTFKLLKILKDNIKTYKPGSNGWWHWIEHSVAAILVFFGSIFRSLFKIIHSTEQILIDGSTSQTYDKWEILTDFFTTFIIMGFIILINHIMSEEIEGGKFEHTPVGERRKFDLTNKNEFNRRIGDIHELFHEIQDK